MDSDGSSLRGKVSNTIEKLIKVCVPLHIDLLIVVYVSAPSSFRFAYSPGTVRIVAGSIDWSNIDEENGQVLSVDRIVVHAGWDKQVGQNDVALLHLQAPLTYVKNSRVVVNRVCLSRQGSQEYSGIATSSGWGFLNKDIRVTPELLRRVDIPVVDHLSCKNAFSRVIGISPNQVCAGQAPRGNCMVSCAGKWFVIRFYSS